MSVLQVEPRQLVFHDVQPNTATAQRIVITNTLPSPVTFTLKSSHPGKYRLSHEDSSVYL